MQQLQPYKKSLIFALDTPDLIQAKLWATKFKNYVWGYKLGLEFFTANGPDGVKHIQELGKPIFLDLKLHDIPNTVGKTIANINKLGVEMTTLHITGSSDMLKAAVDNNDKTLLLGVSVLTSMDSNNLEQIGIQLMPLLYVEHLSKIALKSGIGGVVCSPKEVGPLKQQFGKKLKYITPGVRFTDNSTGDQKRVSTPEQAILSGSDYLVMGRGLLEKYSPI